MDIFNFLEEIKFYVHGKCALAFNYKGNFLSLRGPKQQIYVQIKTRDMDLFDTHVIRVDATL